jgi:hypothetical protein
VTTALVLGAVIGLLLGLLGGGGSILVVPALVYGAGQPLTVAVPTSLLESGSPRRPRSCPDCVPDRSGGASLPSSVAPAQQRRSPAPWSTGCSTPASS